MLKWRNTKMSSNDLLRFYQRKLMTNHVEQVVVSLLKQQFQENNGMPFLQESNPILQLLISLILVLLHWTSIDCVHFPLSQGWFSPVYLFVKILIFKHTVGQQLLGFKYELKLPYWIEAYTLCRGERCGKRFREMGKKRVIPN